MDEIDFLNNLDIYEVDKLDYDAYFYRLPKNELMKTTPREGFVAYKDITDSQYICGILSEQIMGMPANRYFIFNFIDEERLGEHKCYQHIRMSEEEYTQFLATLQNLVGDKNND